MTCRQTPPGRTSISEMVVEKPFGPHHGGAWSAFVHASNTSSRGASTRRASTIARSAVLGSTLVLALLAGMFFFLALKCLQIIVQAVEAFLIEPAVVLHPIGDVLQRARFEPARPPLRVAAARDEARSLQHLEVFGHGREAH